MMDIDVPMEEPKVFQRCTSEDFKVNYGLDQM